jgi:hypothetical protein
LSHQPPDLSQPYGAESERLADRDALLFYWYAIERLIRLAEQPPGEWSSDQLSLFPRSVPGGPPEPPQQRLQRWLTLYGDEVRTIRDLRNRLLHLGPVADSEIRGALYLARNIVASAVGAMPSDAESAARRVLALAS